MNNDKVVSIRYCRKSHQVLQDSVASEKKREMINTVYVGFVNSGYDSIGKA